MTQSTSTSECGDPVEPDALVRAGCAAAGRGHIREALRLFGAAALAGDGAAQLNLGNTYMQLGRRSDAAEAFAAALAAGEEGAAYGLGRALEDMGRADAALEAYQQAWAEGDAKGAIGASWILSDRGHRIESFELLRAAVERGSDLAAGVLGVRLWEEERAREAEGLLSRALSLYPPTRPPLAEMYLEQGRAAEALAVLREGTEALEVECFLPMGNLLYEVADNCEAAEAAYRMGLSLGDANCRLNLALLLRATDREAEGMTLLLAAVEAGDELARKHMEME
ncbi:tetratricopeptide repeat protein [Kineosporia babensis]|uniref:Tetratricopeptide repeat protein n=1 Tax=Kineosporia babensis TaxID=499548 RepID=A0A9X1NFP6_9ACTN|nr:tetratricopeptide repeat protein [Kineosporia babensis]MCD5314252.1 tetratricopeptide repeat protein [Kineosporia babensis]